jgi:DNA gyrase subunit A
VVPATDDESTLLSISTRGLGKRTKLDEYRRQGRGGQGVNAMKLPKGAKIAGAAIVKDDADAMLISSGGVVIRIPVDQISIIGRSTQGVAVMRLERGTEIASMTVFTENGQAELEVIESMNGVEPSNGSSPPE